MIEQGTDAWMLSRLGRVGASRIADIMAETKSGAESASRKNYLAQLVSERLTGKWQNTFMSNEMQWGVDNEPVARALYEVKYDVFVDQSGGFPHPTIEMSGASPDGLIGEDGLIEIKCPNTATHIDTILNSKISSRYVLQMQWQMACTGRKWCDFASYDPRMPEDLALFVIRVQRDEEKISAISSAVVSFLNDVNLTVEKLRNLK